jgi:zinc protease
LDVVDRITRERILEFHKTRYRPGTSRLGIVGNFDPERVIRMVEQYFGAWAPGSAEWPRVVISPPLPRSSVQIINYPQSDETQLIVGNLAVNRFSDDYLVFALLNQILSGRPYGWNPTSKYDAVAAPSRLLARFAGRKGVRRVPLAEFVALKYLQHFAVVTTIDASQVQQTLDDILAEFRSLQDEKVSAEELENAKRRMTTDFVAGLENPYWLCHQVLEYDLLPPGYWDNYVTTLSKISPEDVQRVARKYLPTSSVQILALGPAEKLSQSLLKYGSVEEFDPEAVKIKFNQGH